MFGRKHGNLETIVGNGTCVEGKIDVKGTLRVDGTVEGDVHADWVVVGETGRILGNISARSLLVGGVVEGNIEAADTVELTGKSATTGEIRTPKLTVSEGAVFDGRSRMKSETASLESAEKNLRALAPAK